MQKDIRIVEDAVHEMIDKLSADFKREVVNTSYSLVTKDTTVVGDRTFMLCHSFKSDEASIKIV